MADAHKTAWQYMKQKAPQELVGANGHHALPVTRSVILPSKRDPSILELGQSMVGDGNAMCVASEILQDVCGATERPLGIDDPALPEKLPQKALERPCVGQT